MAMVPGSGAKPALVWSEGDLIGFLHAVDLAFPSAWLDGRPRPGRRFKLYKMLIFAALCP